MREYGPRAAAATRGLHAARAAAEAARERTRRALRARKLLWDENRVSPQQLQRCAAPPYVGRIVSMSMWCTHRGLCDAVGLS